MEFKSDIQIAQESVMTNISKIATDAGIDEKYIEQYGKYKAKIDYSLLKDKENVVAQCGKDNYAIYIDGNPAGDEFSVDGIDLKDYTVKVGDNKLFLISD